MNVLPHPRRLVTTPVWAAALVATVLGLSGCGPTEKPKGTLTGQVMYKGNPVTAGQIDLLSEDGGVGATEQLDATGRFTVDAPLPAGVYTVCILPPKFTPSSEPTKRVTFRDIPEKARDMKTSGLTVTVNQGPNDVVIEVKD